jgi:DNA helicase-2/ATP-dependent DNA helicase PcrA
VTTTTDTRSAREGGDADLDRITAEEEKVLKRVLRTVAERRPKSRAPQINYDAELIALRDQINEARLEDVPPLIEEMERLQQVAARRAKVQEGVVDRESPYFGRLVLEESQRKREVLIGRSTFIDSKTGIRIVDWRDAPVSRIYYRYEEGDDYEEFFGGREVEGDVLTRRSLAIARGELRRIGAPQGTFVRDAKGVWRRTGDSAARLSGGQGAAMRPEEHHKPGRLGVNEGDGRDDKHLQEIAALIDPRQFELITAPESGLVVIQGGAGSGKTTIGLHRLAYLAFQDPKRFRADRMLVIVFNDALARYISRVLPALGVPGVLVTTYERWAHRLRTKHLQGLPRVYDDDTPPVVVRLKKSPAMLRILDEWVDELAGEVDVRMEREAAGLEGVGPALEAWRRSRDYSPAHRLDLLKRFLRNEKGEGRKIPLSTRHALERAAAELRRTSRDVVGAWAEILTDEELVREGFARHAPGALEESELRDALAWCRRKCPRVVVFQEEMLHRERGNAKGDDRDDDDRNRGIDGVEEVERVALDREDDTLLLRLVQKLRGGLGRKRSVLRYEHVFIDEAQDLSPVEMSVVLDAVSDRQSVTLAGDLAQRLHLYNGFSDWRGVLSDLGLDHVKVEPLKLSYRSTHEIIEFATEVLGPLRNEEEGRATRHGVPVELFRFAQSGDAVGFLGEALRDLVASEPQASVAVIARYPEQADLYHRGLENSEVPNLRRISDQDFPFKPGVDVTDVRQVKGLEFDYVVLLEVSSASYPDNEEARHLLHIAATRAAHQLWVTTTSEPSPLVPKELRDRSY